MPKVWGSQISARRGRPGPPPAEGRGPHPFPPPRPPPPTAPPELSPLRRRLQLTAHRKLSPSSLKSDIVKDVTEAAPAAEDCWAIGSTTPRRINRFSFITCPVARKRRIRMLIKKPLLLVTLVVSIMSSTSVLFA